MIYGVHNYYNNNASSIGRFNDCGNTALFPELEVRVTDQGLTIFNLAKERRFSEKLKIARTLDAALEDVLGSRLSFATCGASDCLQEFELVPYYNAMKEINPDIVTIYATWRKFRGTPRGDGSVAELWGACPDDLQVDYIFDMNGGKPASESVVEILRPGEEDRSEPPEGWRAFERKLNKMYARVVESVLNPQDDPEIRGFDRPGFYI